jgi:hypothetical protein
MGETYHWTCPYCDRDTTLRDGDYIFNGTKLNIQNPIDGHKFLRWHYIVCPNLKCKKFTLAVFLNELSWDSKEGWKVGNFVRRWDLIPPSRAKAFPNYIPKPIIYDYNEACLICDLSPKASATLSRRCLQGIIRDFWEVKPGRLIDEIDQIKDKTDPVIWEAIESVRKVGNIGAHMEKDINVIIDVDPNEAQMLIGLVEVLLRDWYIGREERKKRLVEIRDLAEKKDEERKKEKINPQQGNKS